MRLKQLIETWDTNTAQEFLTKIQQELSPTGFKVSIVGSVATHGSSDNDLDLLLVSTTKTDQWADTYGSTDEDPLVTFLNDVGYDVRPKSEELLTIILNDGRVVDLFIQQ